LRLKASARRPSATRPEPGPGKTANGAVELEWAPVEAPSAGWNKGRTPHAHNDVKAQSELNKFN
jgi:hypothetical protein